MNLRPPLEMLGVADADGQPGEWKRSGLLIEFFMCKQSVRLGIDFPVSEHYLPLGEIDDE
jgi:hypothetical protein